MGLSSTRLLWISMLAAALLTAGGCMGGNQNFSSVIDGPAKPLVLASGGQPGPRPGNVAPDFTLQDLDGKSVRLSDFRGRPVMVNFWASWCQPCREEMPTFEAAYKKYRDQGLVFLGVNLQEDRDTVRKFVQEFRLDWTFLLDPDSSVARSYMVTGIPESYFIDRDGVVRDYSIGPLTASGLESKLAKIR